MPLPEEAQWARQALVITAQPRRMGLILGWFKALRELRGGSPAWTWGLRRISQKK